MRNRPPARVLSRLALLLPIAAGCVAGAARAEIFTAGGAAIRVYADDADGDAAPIRSIVGPATQLVDPVSLTLDLVHRELWVTADPAAVLVFAMDASGDVAPLRVLSGAATGLVTPRGMAIDLASDEVFVSDFDADAVFVFDRTADGDVAPKRKIQGAATQLDGPTLLFLDRVHDELLVGNLGFTTAPGIYVFHPADHDDVAPQRAITAASGIDNPRSAVVDLGRDELYVTEYDQSSVKVFARDAADGDLPLRIVGGASTSISKPFDLTLTRDGEMLLGEDGNLPAQFVGQAQTADGDVAPTRHVTGVDTLLDAPVGLVSSRARECSSGRSVDGCLFRDDFEGADACAWTTASGAAACP